MARNTTECRFEYIWQPSSTNLGDCNPYMGMGLNLMIRILLECIERRHSGVTDQFDIRWIRESTTGTVEDLGPGLNTRSTNELTSKYSEPVFTNQTYIQPRFSWQVLVSGEHNC